MKITPAQSGSGAFKSLWAHAMKHQTIIERSDPARLYNLRCSAIPYCPRSVLFKWATTGLAFEMEMTMAYYVGVGHAVHDVAQRYLALSGDLLADYRCKVCKKWHRLSHKHTCCGVPCEYHELTIDYKGIVGHIDAVVKIRGHYYIVDFKTTSINGSYKKQTQPGSSYKAQITAYAYLLQKQYGIRVKGVILAFIPRDNPHRLVTWEAPVTDALLEKTRRALKADKRLHRLTMKAKTMDDFKELLEVFCDDAYCDACRKVSTPGFLKLLKQHRGDFPIKRE